VKKPTRVNRWQRRQRPFAYQAADLLRGAGFHLHDWNEDVHKWGREVWVRIDDGQDGRIDIAYAVLAPVLPARSQLIVEEQRFEVTKKTLGTPVWKISWVLR
jgi:hypothetical protein